MLSLTPDLLSSATIKIYSSLTVGDDNILKANYCSS